MKKLFFLLACILPSLIQANGLDAPSGVYVPSENDRSFITRFHYVPLFKEGNIAMNYLGEPGPDQWRGNVALGACLSDHALVQCSVEYLTQKHKLGYRPVTVGIGGQEYPLLPMQEVFTFEVGPGSTHRWLQQGGVGLGFLYLFDDCKCENIEFNVNYSHARGKHLPPKQVDFITFERGASRSNAFDFNVGTTFGLWPCAEMKAWLGYESVHYSRKYLHHIKVCGIGGGARLSHHFNNCFGIEIEGELKHAYNYLRTSVNYSPRQHWGVSAFASFVDGHKGLNNDAKIGIGLTYCFDKIPGCFGTCASQCGDCPRQCVVLEDWIAHPSIYRPTVLSISDQRIMALLD